MLTRATQYRPVNIHTGVAAYNTVDSLSAFWPGLQVLAGDIENAIKSHLICASLVLPLDDVGLTITARLEPLATELWATRGVGYKLQASDVRTISVATWYVSVPNSFPLADPHL